MPGVPIGISLRISTVSRSGRPRTEETARTSSCWPTTAPTRTRLVRALDRGARSPVRPAVARAVGGAARPERVRPRRVVRVVALDPRSRRRVARPEDRPGQTGDRRRCGGHGHLLRGAPAQRRPRRAGAGGARSRDRLDRAGRVAGRPGGRRAVDARAQRPADRAARRDPGRAHGGRSAGVRVAQQHRGAIPPRGGSVEDERADRPGRGVPARGRTRDVPALRAETGERAPRAREQAFALFDWFLARPRG